MTNRRLRISFALACAQVLLAVARAGAPQEDGAEHALRELGCWQAQRGVTIRLDNDLLSGSARDADYTGGFAVEWTPEGQELRHRPHRLHSFIDGLFGLDASNCRHHAWQLGLIAITPRALRSEEPVLDDRPYASALLLGTTATWQGSDDRTAWQSVLQIGVLGLSLAERLQSTAHRVFGGAEPRGYANQISRGGELTARYVLARHNLLYDGVVRGETLQVKGAFAASVGFLTEISAGWAARWGRISSPWQSFTPEVTGYLPAPVPLAAESRTADWYAVAGARVKLRGYNSLAQGQFRDSVHVLRSSELERLIAEVWAGVTWHAADDWEVSYLVRAQTPELRDNPSRRTMMWAELSVARRF